MTALASINSILNSAEDRRERLLEAIEVAVFNAIVAFNAKEAAAQRPPVVGEEVTDVLHEVANVGGVWGL